jgi:AbrB family looped-hinge helix DNA binding protein
MGIAKVTRNYQVTIPRDIRILHDIKVGDTVVFVAEGDKIELLKLRKDILDNALGSWKEVRETGASIVRSMRKEWQKREQRWA